MIDTHTHIFPDKIAARAAQKFQATVGDAFHLAGDFIARLDRAIQREA